MAFTQTPPTVAVNERIRLPWRLAGITNIYRQSTFALVKCKLRPNTVFLCHQSDGKRNKIVNELSWREGIKIILCGNCFRDNIYPVIYKAVHCRMTVCPTQLRLSGSVATFQVNICELGLFSATGDLRILCWDFVGLTEKIVFMGDMCFREMRELLHCAVKS